MPTTLKHTIDAYTTGDYLDEVKISNKIELTKRKGTDGTTKKGKAFDPTAEFSVKGGGSSGLTVGVVSMSITTGLSGGVKYLTKDDYTQKNADFDDFESSGEHLPGASDQA
jgi:hypothetical protein